MASVYKPTGRNIWRIEFTDDRGHPRTISSGVSNEKLAEAIAKKLEEDVERVKAGYPLLHPDVTARHLHAGRDQQQRLRPWDDVVTAYLNELVRRGSAPDSHHYRDSRTLLAAIHRECGWQQLADVRADQFTEFLGKLAARGRAPRTQNRYFETLRNFLNFCVQQGWLDKSPLTRVRPVKVGQAGRRRLRRPFTLAELTRLLAAATARRQMAYRVAVFSGLRRGELRRLQKQDCTPTGDRPRWHVDAARTKNRQPIRLPMTPECAEALRDHWQRLPAPTSRLLIIPDKETFLADLARAGIPRQDERGRWADFHSFRYTFCLLMSRHHPVEKVSKLMRHGSLHLTTSIYLDLGLDREGEGAETLPRVLQSAEERPKSNVLPETLPPEMLRPASELPEKS